jgi:hypothetical protein
MTKSIHDRINDGEFDNKELTPALPRFRHRSDWLSVQVTFG